MKNIVSVLLLLALLISCSQPEHYTITGTLEGFPEGKIYLQKRGTGLYMKIDSAEVTDGKFTFTGKVKVPEMYLLSIEGIRSSASIWLENSEITVTANADTLHKAVIKGSSVQDEYDGYNEQLRSIYSTANDFYATYKEADKNDDEETMQLMEDKMDSIYKSAEQFQKDFIRKNPASFIVPSILRSINYEMDADELAEYLDLLDPVLDSTAIIIYLQERVEILRKVDVGKPAMDFTQNDQNGDPVTLSSLFGNYLLIDFWAAWCGPCRRENPNVVACYAEFHDKGFDVLGVSLDHDKAAWLKAIEDDGLTWNHVSDLKGWGNAVSGMYGINSIPSNLLLDKQGIIIGKNLRGDELKNKLAELMP